MQCCRALHFIYITAANGINCLITRTIADLSIPYRVKNLVYASFADLIVSNRIQNLVSTTPANLIVPDCI